MSFHSFFFRIFIAPAVWLLLLFGSAHAQIWTQVFGPTGGDVEAIASDRFGHIFAGTDSGVYVSGTNGADWAQKNNGLVNLEIFSFVATPTGSLLAGTEGGGIFRTTNFGDTWDSSNIGLPVDSYILSLASDGRGNIYAGHSTQGVFYSSDDGIHWAARDTGMQTETIFSLTVAPSGVVYAGGTGIIYASPDFGVHWDTSIIVGPVTGKNAEEVLALAADSAGNIYAGTFRGSRWRLRAGSTMWENISPIVISGNSEIRAMATSGKIIFAGLFGGGILQSMDLGQDWSDWSAGLTDPKIYSLTVSPSGFVFAGTYLADVFRTNFPLAVTAERSMSNGLDVWPQPLGNETNITFSLLKPGPAEVKIFDALGREVRTVWNGVLAAGSQIQRLDASSLPSGAYLVVLNVSGEVRSVRCACLH